MARLMVVPIRNRGDSVLIITRHADVELIGFVARTTLRGLLKYNPSMCDCILFVQEGLPMMEQILLRKSLQGKRSKGQMPCVEITAADLSPIQAAGARPTFDMLRVSRGDMENRIKECQLDLYADRTWTATMRANQLRLWFASMAYVLL